jgi:hypothetical protein
MGTFLLWLWNARAFALDAFVAAFVVGWFGLGLTAGETPIV